MFGQNFERRHDPGLARPVVIAHHDQRGIGADVLRRRQMLDRSDDIVAAASGDHRHAPPGDLDRDPEQPMLLLIGQRRAFAGGAARDQRAGTLVDLPFDQVSECRFIDSARRKRSHERWYRPEKHE